MHIVQDLFSLEHYKETERNGFHMMLAILMAVYGEFVDVIILFFIILGMHGTQQPRVCKPFAHVCS